MWKKVLKGETYEELFSIYYEWNSQCDYPLNWRYELLSMKWFTHSQLQETGKKGSDYQRW